MSPTGFYCGVIEGFYGPPWRPAQRRRLLDWMRSGGLNSYLYAPKDDVKHRTRWRELYDEAETIALREMIDGCRRSGIEFAYAIAPGLDLHYSTELGLVQKKLQQLAALGVRTFALLFDDISQALRPEDAAQFRTFAGAQVHIANELFAWLRNEFKDSSLWFCPTIYFGRFADNRVRESPYLIELGDKLHPEIEVMWTGPEVVSETIPVASVREVAAVLRRRPLIWDNLHANDYDFRRMYLGPLSGRQLELRDEVRGILSNPNCEFEANFIPLFTLGAYASAQGGWDEIKALRDACEAWLPAFGSRGNRPFSLPDLELLTDLFYLPHHTGPRAEQLVDDFEFLVRHPVAAWGGRYQRFEKTCDDIAVMFAKLTELDDRELCFTFYRIVHEVNWEIVPMRGFINWRKSSPPPGTSYRPLADHRPPVYRGGVVARLQRVMLMDEHGTFTAASPPSSRGATEPIRPFR